MLIDRSEILIIIIFIEKKNFSSVGCWKRSAGAITATAILMLTACLLASGAMGLWHTVEFFEKEKVVGEEFYQQWPSVSYKYFFCFLRFSFIESRPALCHILFTFSLIPLNT